MRRRDALALLALGVAPSWGTAYAQSPSGKVGYLHPQTVSPNAPTILLLKPIWEGLGYRGGETFLLRSAGGDLDRLPALAQELVDSGADTIIATGPAAVAAAGRTRASVVAIDLETDPIHTGLVASFGRPGGNVTGLFLDQPSLAGKWVELLREAAPMVEQVVLLASPESSSGQLAAAQGATHAHGLGVKTVAITKPERFDYQAGLQDLGPRLKTACILLGAPGLSIVGKQFATAALAHGYPTVSHQRFYAVDGALMAYGPARDAYFIRAVMIADRIAKGEKAADIPIERPSRFEFIINLKTARALGLGLPDTLLLQADEVIE